MAELLVWVGGDRNVLDPMERRDGYVTAIKGDGHVWGSGDLTNHRVVRLPGVEIAAVRHLLEQRTTPADPATGKRKVIGRRRILLSRPITNQLKALNGGDKAVTRTLDDVSRGQRRP